MRFAFCLIVLLIVPVIKGSGTEGPGKVIIHGNAPGHAGEEIVFYSWTDQISFTRAELFRIMIGENEQFSVDIMIDDGPEYIFSHTGIYFLYMYIEPGREYEVILPEKTDKSIREELNPYFEGIPTHLAVLNHDSTELNALIRAFDDMYDPLFGEKLIRLTVERDQGLLDSIQGVFDRRFVHSANPYFNAYRNYKMALLKIMSQMRTARSISESHFRSEPVLYNNVAYMELFNQVYNRYFLFFSRTVRGNRIFSDINNNRSLTDLRNTLGTDPLLGEGRLLELVILKGLHDSFYGSDFSRTGLLAVLDSIAGSTLYSEHSSIAGHIRSKVTRLLAGFQPPGFELMNRDGEMLSLSDFKGYYVYLNFCTAASYSCLSEYDVLSRLNSKHSENLKIVTVFIDDSYESMLEFLSRNDYDWEFLFYGNQPSILKEYDIRMFPSYYLVDRDGTLLMSPAPSPAEGFENSLLRTLRNRREIR
jgi:peroxiredoxin